MKVKITQRGVYGADDKALAVGTMLEVPDGELPSYLVGKAEAVAGEPQDAPGKAPAKAAVTNPATGAKPGA